jgi:hypothetical protein
MLGWHNNWCRITALVERYAHIFTSAIRIAATIIFFL